MRRGPKTQKISGILDAISLRAIRENLRSMYARVSQAMGQFVLKVEILPHIMGATPMLEMARLRSPSLVIWLLTQLNPAAILFDQRSSICHVRSVVPYVEGEDYKLYNFKSFWNWVEIFQVFCSVPAVIMYMAKSERVTSAVRKLQDNVYANESFQEAIAWLEFENTVLGILTFIVTAKLLRLIRFNQHVEEFSQTSKTLARLLSSFVVLLLIFFVTFIHFGILIFGKGSEFYSSVLKAKYFQLEFFFFYFATPNI